MLSKLKKHPKPEVIPGFVKDQIGEETKMDNHKRLFEIIRGKIING
jgi:hypothetical protein